MSKHKRNWFKIDNAGKLYPSIMSTRVSTVFRISATINKTVNKDILQKAVNRTIKRFPYFQVVLKKGIFWYYFVTTNQIPIVEKERFYPCMFLSYKSKDRLPFRVLYFNNKISLEISHSITDGTGAMVFFKTLLVEYYRHLGVIVKNNDDIISIEDPIEADEYEDAFHKYYNKDIPSIDRPPKAYHFPFKLNKKGEYYIVTGIVSSEQLYKKAKEYNASVTQFLLALYFYSIQQHIGKLSYKKRLKKAKNISINLPVNLRGFYPSNTLRNFFISLTPHIDARLGDYTLEELIYYVKYYCYMNINKRIISQHISRNVKNEKLLFIRLIPLPIKNLFIPTIYHQFGERSYTSSISNLGKITIPEELKDYIERIEFYPPPSKGNKIKMTVNTFKDKTYINFGSMTKNREIERNFFTNLRKMGLAIKIETND